MGFSDTREPDVAVLANGVDLGGVVDLEVSSNSFFASDRYRLSLAMSVSGYNVWSSPSVDLDISIGLSGAWLDVISGPVDRVEVDVARQLIQVEGRDLSARFIEARTQESFDNRTSSEIATTLALRRGLIPAVSPTSTLAGRDYGGDHSNITLDQYSGTTTEWDVLVKLAELEGFDVWTRGRTLNFQSSSAGTDTVLIRPSDCMSLHLEKVFSLTGGLRVTVKSWDSRGQIAISQVVSTAGATDSSRQYVLVQPNLTSLAAERLAQRLLADMAQNGRQISFQLPGDTSLLPRQTVLLAGTETDFDGIYVVTSVERHLSFERGYTQTIHARIPPWTAF